MKILVTGANGFIGRSLVKILRENEIDVVATDFRFDDINENNIAVDLFDESIDYYELFGKPDTVLHLAWRDGFIHNSSSHMLDISKHYSFLSKMATSGVNKITVLGTMHEVGYYEGAVDSETQCNPLSQYGIAKNALRKSVEIMCAENNITYQWLRVFYIISDNIEGASIFSKIQQASRLGKEKFPFTKGLNKYDFITKDELCFQIYKAVIQNEITGIINCCTGTPISLANKIEQYILDNHLNIELEYGVYPERSYDSPAIWGDNCKINKILNT